MHGQVRGRFGRPVKIFFLVAGQVHAGLPGIPASDQDFVLVDIDHMVNLHSGKHQREGIEVGLCAGCDFDQIRRDLLLINRVDTALIIVAIGCRCHSVLKQRKTEDLRVLIHTLAFQVPEAETNVHGSWKSLWERYGVAANVAFFYR